MKHRRTVSLLLAFTAALAVTTTAMQASPQDRAPPQNPPSQALKLDPAVFVSVAQVWELIAGPHNPVWPGWDASTTPALIYFPNEQEVLLNHPSPPDGFVRADGLLPLSRRPNDRVWVRNGKTQFDIDGQNTQTDINGVPTLVVADTLSNRRSWLSGVLRAQGTIADREDQLTLRALSGSPYDLMALIAHEAFHVFQHNHAPHKTISEQLILDYPALSGTNNLGFALEGQALAAGMRATSADEMIQAAQEVIAVRNWRRKHLSDNAILYEDGVEFSEGLAKYVEYAWSQKIEGHAPIPEMAWVRGFNGFDDMATQRAALVKSLLGVTDGSIVVNNDPYGAAPVRFRLYSTGMAMAVILDQLDTPDWRTRILQPDVTLTELLRERLGKFDEAAVLARVLATDYAAEQRLRTEALAKDGEAANSTLLASIFAGEAEAPSWRLEIDYSALAPVSPAFGYTSFGVTRLDGDKIIYRQVPISGEIEGGGKFRQARASPLLHDQRSRKITFRIQGKRPDPTASGVQTLSDLSLPGVDLDFAYGRIEVINDTILIQLLPAPSIDTRP